MININEFPNISELTDIEENIRVFAGPGAGKTTWFLLVLERAKQPGSFIILKMFLKIPNDWEKLVKLPV